ncbi:MAG: DUF502 domain-containing protein [Candidatus Hydrogenedentes bacterium]|nr:DUF502 domain-containing protein [Candidatus Hydrogenedentota bacterium]
MKSDSTLQSIRKRLVSGLLVVVPAGITLLILSFFYNVTVGMVVPLAHAFLVDMPYPVVALFSFLVLFLALYLTGMLASLVIGRRLIHLAEWIVDQIPLVKTVYSVSKQVIDLFLNQRPGEGQQVVLVEFPGPGLRAFGFVTGRITGPDGLEYFKVFIPTTPNPTTGFLELVPAATTPVLQISMEEAISLIMSGGFLGPERLTASPPHAGAGHSAAVPALQEDQL